MPRQPARPLAITRGSPEDRIRQRMQAPDPDARFLTTRWSLVAAAGDSERAREALGELARAYAYPLYAFARRLGVPAGEAEDVVQDFFARWVEKRDLARFVRGEGRFRSFLRVALRNHVANLRDRARADRRGGGRVRLAIDLSDAERRLVSERAAPDESPERAYERTWAREVLARSLERLREEYERTGRGEVFGVLAPHLQGGGDIQADAVRLGLEPGAVRVAVHRLRRRFRDALDQEVSETVDGRERVADEIGELLRALGGEESGRGR